MYRLFLLFLISGFCGYSQLPTWEWAKNIAQFDPQGNGSQVVADRFGNSYVLAQSSGVIATPSVVAAAGFYVASYNRHGQWRWAQSLPASANTISVDDNGNLYAAGTRGFNSSNSGTGAYIIKFDSAGTMVWERNFSPASNEITTIAVAKGHLLVAGGMTGTMSVGSSTFSTGDDLIFAARLDLDGNLDWLRTSSIIPGTFNGQRYPATRLAVDSLGSVYVAYPGGPDYVWASIESWMLKLDYDGNFIYESHYGAFGESPSGFFIDPSGDIIMTHGYNVSTSAGTLRLSRFNNAMTSKLWSKEIGSWECQNLYLGSNPVQVPDGSIFVAGAAGTSCDGNYSAADTLIFGADTIITDSLADILVAKIDRNTGQYLRAWHVKGHLFDDVFGLAADRNGDLYASGSFNVWGQAGTSVTTDTLCFGNSCLDGQGKLNQTFLAKLKCSALDIGIKEMTQSPVIFLYPNPFKDEINVQYQLGFFDKAQVELIEAATGRILLKQQLSPNESSIKINAAQFASCVYLIRFTRNNEASGYFKLVKIKE